MSLIVCLMGPTASGKTQLAVELVKRFPFEIVSVDSAMIYQHMDIGTAKPEAEILAQAPHRLISICDPSEAYSAARFCEDALCEIKAIQSQNKIPLLVGGTMMYFRALQQGIASMPSADSALRQHLSAEAERMGWPALHKRLEQVDPIVAARVHPHDSQRIQRALEVFMISGKPLSRWQSEELKGESMMKILSIAIAPCDRAILHQRIHDRFMHMLETGFVEEVKRLYQRGDLTLSLPAMRAVGYRQVCEYLEGKLRYEQMCERGIIATRQLAKRQLTWLRRWPNLHWFDSESSTLLTDVSCFIKEQIK